MEKIILDCETEELFGIQSLPELAGTGDALQVGAFVGVGIDLIMN